MGISNVIPSAYGKKDFNQFIKNEREAGRIIYEKKGLDDLPTSGLQLPRAGNASDPMFKISQNNYPVNTLYKSDFANNESLAWTMLDYKDAARRNALTSELHNRMVAENDVVNLTANDLNALSDHFPDLRSLPKKERTPVLKQKMADLKINLRNFLNTLKAGKFEFTVNGNILEAKLYDKGIREVLEKISQEKAAMLYKSREIFEKAQYLYSTPDKKDNPDIYRWNYFYVPINVAGAGTFGVRIAVRDMKTTYQNDPHSQIYNWNIKKKLPWRVLVREIPHPAVAHQKLLLINIYNKTIIMSILKKSPWRVLVWEIPSTAVAHQRLLSTNIHHKTTILSILRIRIVL